MPIEYNFLVSAEGLYSKPVPPKKSPDTHLYYQGTHGIGRDITERKKQEAELRRLYKQRETIFNNLDEMLFSVDAENSALLMISKSCRDITGYTVEEFQNDNGLWFKIIHPEDEKILNGAIKRLVQGESLREQYRIVTKDNKSRRVETRISPTRDDDDALVYFDGIMI